MEINSCAPEELSRQELEMEVARLRELEDRVESLETLVGTLGDTPPEEASLRDLALVSNPVGILIDENRKRLKEIESALQGNENGGIRLGGNRNQMVPIHRMYGDLITGAEHSLNDTQKRAARLYGEFVERVVDGEANKVDASGQMYTLTSGAAEEILLGKYNSDARNLLDGVKKASRSQVIARSMRDVSRLAKFEDCECEKIDECTHSIVQFRSGRPNVVAAPKQSFHEAMENVYNDPTDQPSST